MKKSKASEVVLPLQVALNLPNLCLGTSNSLETSAKVSPYSQQMTISSHKELHYSSHFDNEDIVQRLNQILTSLLSEKGQFQERRAKQKQNLQGQINKRNEIIESLLFDNQKLKDQISKLLGELEQKKQSINALKKQTDKFKIEKDSLKSVIAYLEDKNKEMSFEIYQMKKPIMKKEGLGMQKKTSLDLIPQKMPKYLMDHFDQESIFEYTGNLNRDFSREFQRVESMSAFELVSDMLQTDIPETIIQSGLESYQERRKEKIELSKSNSLRVAAKESKSTKQVGLRKRASICKNDLSKVHVQTKKKGIKESKPDTSNKKEVRQDVGNKNEQRGAKRRCDIAE